MKGEGFSANCESSGIPCSGKLCTSFRREAIAVEDLSGIYESSKIPARWLRRWAYDELQRFIEYKAGEHGIKFIKVEAAGTSQTCSKCGHRDRANRKSQAQFECINCGHTENADLNASRNIAVLGKNKYAQSA